MTIDGDYIGTYPYTKIKNLEAERDLWQARAEGAKAILEKLHGSAGLDSIARFGELSGYPDSVVFWLK